MEKIANIIKHFAITWNMDEDWYNVLLTYVCSYMKNRWIKVSKSRAMDIFHEVLLWIKTKYKEPKNYPFWIVSYFNLCIMKFSYKIISISDYAVDIPKAVFEKVLSDTKNEEWKAFTKQLIEWLKTIQEIGNEIFKEDPPIHYEILYEYILSLLDDNDKILFEKHFINKMSAIEIASESHISKQWVWQRLKNIKNVIKCSLEL